MRPYRVDVPVRVMIWTRPELQKMQFEVIRQAAPSKLFLVSDGGRNEKEKELIRQSRTVVEDIDWDCEVHKLYFEENQGLYTMLKIWSEYIWERVDRCVFLEDDYIPSVSFFDFCAELLEKYKDDERIEMITGNNVLGTYAEAEPYDYFFTEVGWSIWGIATWKRVARDYEYPLDYADNMYIRQCLRDNLTPFWAKKAEGYCNGELIDGHVPGSEYFHGINSALYHRLSIVPTRNMINNIGMMGEHFKVNDGSSIPEYMNLETYELNHPIRHPKYMIDDKRFGVMYEYMVEHRKTAFQKLKELPSRIRHFIVLIIEGRLFKRLKEKYGKNNEILEK